MVQVTEDGGCKQGGSRGDGARGSDSGQMLMAEPEVFLRDPTWNMGEKMRFMEDDTKVSVFRAATH